MFNSVIVIVIVVVIVIVIIKSFYKIIKKNHKEKS